MIRELEKEAKIKVDAFIDNFKQDVKSDLYDRLNQEDVKDFLYALYIDSAEPREKRITNLEITNNKISNECHKLVDTLEKKQNEYELLETQNIKLQAEVSRLTIKNADLIGKIAFTENALNNAKAQIEKMKSDVKQEQSYWNSGEMQYDLYQRLLDKWEIKEND